MIFVDTSGWYAAYVPSDPYYSQVKPLVDNATTRLITTDYILAESLTLLRVRNEYPRSLVLGANLIAQASAQLIYLTPQDIEQAWIVFSTYRDKAWSFVDCSSYVIMQRMKIREAISLDQHFHQMHGITVFP
jgi:predicted nucleic acid-binding protein